MKDIYENNKNYIPENRDHNLRQVSGNDDDDDDDDQMMNLPNP